MKENIKELWDGLDEKTKNRLTTVLVGVVLGIFGTVVLDTEMAKDRELDVLCGDDRSRCIQVPGELTCGSLGMCGRNLIWAPKEPIRK